MAVGAAVFIRARSDPFAAAMPTVHAAAGDTVSVRIDLCAGAMPVVGAAAGAIVSVCTHSSLFTGAMLMMSAHARGALLARVPTAVARRVLRFVFVA